MSYVYHVVSPVPFHVHTGRPVVHGHRMATPCNMVLAGQYASVRTISLGDLGNLKTFPGPGTQENSTWRGHPAKEDTQEQLPFPALVDLSCQSGFLVMKQGIFLGAWLEMLYRHRLMRNC